MYSACLCILWIYCGRATIFSCRYINEWELYTRTQIQAHTPSKYTNYANECQCYCMYTIARNKYLKGLEIQSILLFIGLYGYENIVANYLPVCLAAAFSDCFFFWDFTVNMFACYECVYVCLNFNISTFWPAPNSKKIRKKKWKIKKNILLVCTTQLTQLICMHIKKRM